MRETLIAFIRSAQEAAGDDPPRLRTLFTLGNAEQGMLWFGYGYFARDKVLWWPPFPGDDSEQVSETVEVENGVDRFLAAHGVTP